MLKSSPILSPSAAASPNSFHHAPSPSLQEPAATSSSCQSPPDIPSAKSLRRDFSRSAVTSIDCSSTPATESLEPSPTTAPFASALSVNHCRSIAPTFSSSEACLMTATMATGCAPAVPTQTSESTTAQAPSTASPNKRRSHSTAHHVREEQASVAPAHACVGSDANGDGAAVQPSPSTSFKRAKPDDPPAKLLPKRYELCPVESMVELIAYMLSELIATNDAILISSVGLTRFHSRTAPTISVRDYLHRLAKHATLAPPLLLAMVYYIDRLCALYADFTINTLTVHRFLITAATVAAKGLSDSFWNNTTYARVGGVRVAELRLLELEFLYRVDWRIVPNPEVLVAYYNGLVQRCPGYEIEPDEVPEDDDNNEEDEDEGDDHDDDDADETCD